jgi:hypothetical protein
MHVYIHTLDTVILMKTLKVGFFYKDSNFEVKNWKMHISSRILFTRRGDEVQKGEL